MDGDQEGRRKVEAPHLRQGRDGAEGSKSRWPSTSHFQSLPLVPGLLGTRAGGLCPCHPSSIELDAQARPDVPEPLSALQNSCGCHCTQSCVHLSTWLCHHRLVHMHEHVKA